jgi:hypothetical protein
MADDTNRFVEILGLTNDEAAEIVFAMSEFNKMDEEGIELRQKAIKMFADAAIDAIDSIEEKIENLDRARSDFNLSMSSNIAGLRGQSGEFRGGRINELAMTLVNATDGMEAMGAATELAGLLMEDFSDQVAMLNDNLAESLANLSGEYDELIGLVDDLAANEQRRAEILERQEAKTREFSDLRFRAGMGFEELNAEEVFDPLTKRFEELFAGGDIEGALAIAQELQGSIGSARGQSLIGRDEQFRRLDVVESLFGRAFGAQTEAANVERSSIFQNISESSFGQRFGDRLQLTEGGGETQLTLDGREVTSAQLRQEAELLFQSEQIRLQEETKQAIETLSNTLADTLFQIQEMANIKTDQNIVALENKIRNIVIEAQNLLLEDPRAYQAVVDSIENQSLTQVNP